MDLSEKKVMILGHGISGTGAMRALTSTGICRPYFYQEDLDIEFDIASDLNNLPNLRDLCELYGLPYLSGLSGLPDLIVTSPGIASHPAIDFARGNNIPVISELELGYLLNSTPVVAVTGTNGKTTVTRLITNMLATQLKAVACGNIGNAFSLAALGQHEVAVVEASSFQLDRCYEFRPKVAIITNITPDHLDRHGNMENYIKAKFRIAQNQQEGDYLILPYAYASYITSLNIKARIIYSDVSGEVRDNGLYLFEEFIAPLDGIKLSGKHNLENITQAAIAAKLMGISDENIAKAIRDFVPDAHRLARVADKCGKSWFDDSKATNIDSCIRACQSMDGATALILGGSDKGYEYDELFLRLPPNIKDIFVMGAVAEKLIAAAIRCKLDVKINIADDAINNNANNDGISTAGLNKIGNAKNSVSRKVCTIDNFDNVMRDVGDSNAKSGLSDATNSNIGSRIVFNDNFNGNVINSGKTGNKDSVDTDAVDNAKNNACGAEAKSNIDICAENKNNSSVAFGADVKIFRVKNLDEAVIRAKELDVKNVLLSPAAASFDKYLDYKERGRHFEKLVKNL